MFEKWYKSKQFEIGIGVVGVFYLLILTAASVLLIQFLVRQTFLSFGTDIPPKSTIETFQTELVQ
jgi:hypothetical protein